MIGFILNATGYRGFHVGKSTDAHQKPSCLRVRSRRLSSILAGSAGVFAGDAVIVRGAALVRTLFLLLFATTAAGATTYYVSPSGLDTYPGTIDLPFKTLQRGADVALPGDTVIAMDGVYTSAGNRYRDRVLQINHGGTAADPITFKAQHKWEAIIDGQNYDPTTGLFGVVFLNGRASYTNLDGFQIRSINTGALWLFGTSTAPVHDINITNNWVHDIGRFMSADCVTDSGASGAYSNGDVYNVDWAYNVFQDIGRIPNLACDANMSTTHNYRHDHGLYLQGKGHNVHHNVFISMYAGYAIKADGHYEATTGPTHIIRNNTFAFPTNPHEVSGHVRLFSNDQGGGQAEQNAGRTMMRAHDVLIENNISYLPPDHSDQRPGNAAWGPTFVDALYDGFMYHLGTIARNNLTTTSSTLDEAFGGTEIASKVTFSGNQVNVVASSIFVDPAGHDFHLKAGSPAIGAGVGGVDLGAFPYTDGPVAPTDTTPPIDTTPPTSSITSPADGTTVAGLVTIAVQASDNVSVVRVDFYIDTTMIGSSTAPYTLTWDSGTRTNGMTTLSAKAYDAAGNYKSSPNVFVMVNN